MKTMTRILIVFLFIFTSSTAFSAQTAEELLEKCISDSDDNSYCAGYIAGFYDGRTTLDYGKKELRTCPPLEEDGQRLKVTYSQMMRVYIKWAKDHPDKLHYMDWQAVRQAFAEAWPCK